MRRLHKVRIGFKNHKDLEQAIRAHANFNEFVPLGLILLACLEINQVHKIVIIILGGLLFIGINGFGILSVIGRNRFPLPPAKIIAFMLITNIFYFLTYVKLYDHLKSSQSKKVTY